MRISIAAPLALFVAFGAPLAQAGTGSVRTPVAQIFSRFEQHWKATDAAGLSRLFSRDADFVAPDGTFASGRANIEHFYAAAFAHGYAGSAGTGKILSVRALGHGLVFVDAQWRIASAHKPDGSLRPDETGILAAVIRRGSGGWQILRLRENEGAADLHVFAAR